MKSAARRFAVMGASAVVVAASLWPPDVALRAFAPLIDVAGRAFAFSASIVLEAAPYIFCGAVFAAIAMRIRLSAMPTAFVAMIAPGCDCSMNGFAAALTRAPAPIAAFAMAWSVACNPIALLATQAILGTRVLIARIAAGLVAGGIAALTWPIVTGRRTPEHDCAGQPLALITHFASGLTALAPAAVVSAALIATTPWLVRAHLGVMSAVLLGAVMSPCSTADAILARTLVTSAPAQAAFVIGAQLLGVRQLALLVGRFGLARAALTAVAAIAGCAAAVAIARPK